MAREKRLSLLITGDAKQAQKALADLERTAGKSGKGTEKALDGIKGKIIDIGVVAGAAFAFNEFNESQKIAKQTEAVIASTGAAANVSADQIGDYADEMARKTGIDDEAIQAGENWLATFTKVRNEAGEGNDIFTQASDTMLDLSVAMGTDAKQAANLLGKALNDPVKGVTALSRAGVQFTTQQREQIKALTESGDLLGAQKIILKELRTQVEGSAEAQATAYDKAKVSAGNLAETVGGVLAPAIETAATGAADAADWFGELDRWQQTLTLSAAGGAYAWLRWSDEIKVGFSAARSGVGTAKSLKAAIDGIAATKGVSKTRASFEVLKQSMIGADSRAASMANTFAKYPTSMGLAAGGVAALSMALIDMAEDSARAKKNAQSLLDISEELGGSLEQAFNRKLVNTIAGVADGFDLGGSGRVFGQRIKEVGVEFEQLQRAITGTDDQYDQLYKTVAENRNVDSTLLEDLRDLRDAYKKSEEQKQSVIETSKLLGVQVNEETGEFENNTSALQDSADATDDAKTSLERISGYIEKVKDKYDDATRSIKDYYDAATATVSSQIDVERALIDLDDALDRNGTALSIAGKKGQENRLAMIDAKNAAVEYALQLRDTEGPQAAVNAMEQYRLKLEDTLLQSGFTEDQVKSLIEELGLTPTDIYTTFGSNADGQKVTVQGYKAEVKDVPTFWETYFQVNIDQAMQQLALLGAALTPFGTSALSGTAGRAAQEYLDRQRRGVRQGPPRAGGGSVFPGVLYPINEKGVEGFVPSVPGRVIPNDQIGSVLGGGSTVTLSPQITIVEASNPRETARQVVAEIKRLTRANGGRSPIQGDVLLSDLR